MVYVTNRGQQPSLNLRSLRQKKIIIYIKNPYVMLWQAELYNQNDVSLRAAWRKLEGLVRPAGCVFHNPVFDGSAATLCGTLLGPPVASEDKGPNVMVGAHLAACSTNGRSSFFHYESLDRPVAGCRPVVGSLLNSSSLYIHTADVAWIKANQLSRFGKWALQLMARQREVMHSRWLHCTVRRYCHRPFLHGVTTVATCQLPHK